MNPERDIVKILMGVCIFLLFAAIIYDTIVIKDLAHAHTEARKEYISIMQDITASGCIMHSTTEGWRLSRCKYQETSLNWTIPEDKARWNLTYYNLTPDNTTHFINNTDVYTGYFSKNITAKNSTPVIYVVTCGLNTCNKTYNQTEARWFHVAIQLQKFYDQLEKRRYQPTYWKINNQNEARLENAVME